MSTAAPTPEPRLSGRPLVGDAVAGVTVAAMLVPQAMAYAALAGLPPQVGLYASTLPLVLYALVGTSRQLAVGPVAIVSLLTATALAGVADLGPDQRVAAAALLALLVGVVHLALGIARSGFVVRLLSHPALVGFTTAAALLIAGSQVPSALGVSVPRADRLHEMGAAVVRALPDTHGPTAAVAVGSVLALVALRRWVPRAPGALVVVVLAVAASAALGLEGRGVAVVGDIARGLPSLDVPSDGALAGRLVPAALLITAVGYMESIAVARVYARRHGHTVDADRELLGLGLANVGAGLVGGYPVTGGFSRTAVNADAGARSRAAGAITAGVVAVIVAVATPLLRDLPTATLAAIVLVAVTKLVDPAEIRRIARVTRSDLVAMLVAFAGTVVLGIEAGIAVAVAIGPLAAIWRMMAPHTAVLGRVPASGRYHDLARVPSARRVPGVVIVRVDVSLSHLSVDLVCERVRRAVGDAGLDAHAVVVDASGVNAVDATAIDALADLADELERGAVVLHIAGLKGPVHDVMARAGFAARFDGRLHPDLDHAVRAAQAFA